jgi:hypothetical protein
LRAVPLSQITPVEIEVGVIFKDQQVEATADLRRTKGSTGSSGQQPGGG